MPNDLSEFHTDFYQAKSNFLHTLTRKSKLATGDLLNVPELTGYMVIYAPEVINNLKESLPIYSEFPLELEESLSDIANDHSNVEIDISGSKIIYGNDPVKPKLFTTRLRDCMGIIIHNPNAAGSQCAQTGMYHLTAWDSNAILHEFLQKFDPLHSKVYLSTTFYTGNALRVIAALQKYGFKITGFNIPDLVLVECNNLGVFYMNQYHVDFILDPAGTAVAIDCNNGKTSLYRSSESYVAAKTEQTITLKLYPLIAKLEINAEQRVEHLYKMHEVMTGLQAAHKITPLPLHAYKRYISLCNEIANQSALTVYKPQQHIYL